MVQLKLKTSTLGHHSYLIEDTLNILEMIGLFYQQNMG